MQQSQAENTHALNNRIAVAKCLIDLPQLIAYRNDEEKLMIAITMRVNSILHHLEPTWPSKQRLDKVVHRVHKEVMQEVEDCTLPS
jgi:hypothetical protein